MAKYRNWLWLLLFGSLWGINEVVVGEILYELDVPHSSVILTAIALLILAMARGMINRPASSTLAGGVAVVFRLVNTAPSYCHLLGIFLLGMVFDIFASILLAEKTKVSWKHGLTGLASAYGNNIVFAVLMAYIIRYEYWVAEGLPKLTRHIFSSGTLLAVASIFMVPLGFWLGVNSGTLAEKRPYWSYGGMFLCTVAIWTAAFLLA